MKVKYRNKKYKKYCDYLGFTPTKTIISSEEKLELSKTFVTKFNTLIQYTYPDLVEDDNYLFKIMEFLNNKGADIVQYQENGFIIVKIALLSIRKEPFVGKDLKSYKKALWMSFMLCLDCIIKNRRKK